MPRFTRRARRAALLVAATAALTTGFLAAPAHADPHGTGTSDTGSLPPDMNHTYCFRGTWMMQNRNLAHDAMRVLDAQTDMTVAFEARCTPTTDVVFIFDRSPTHAYGTNYCVRLHSTPYTCTQSEVRVNFDIIRQDGVAEGAADGFIMHQARWTLCHEIGHSVGLTHSPDGKDCMRYANWNPALFTSQYQRYSPEHVRHINSRRVSLS